MGLPLVATVQQECDPEQHRDAGNRTAAIPPAAMPSVHASGRDPSRTPNNVKPSLRDMVEVRLQGRQILQPPGQTTDKIITASGHPVIDPHTVTAI